jgi:transcription elongation factor GreA
VPAERLIAALEVAPEDPRVRWAAGFALAREGRVAEARRHVVASLEGFLHKRDLGRIEEGFLFLLETDDRGVAESLLATLVHLTRQEGATAAAPMWDLAGDLVAARGLDETAWAFFRDHLARHPEQDALRAAAARAFRGVALARGIPEDALAVTGLDRSLRPVQEAITRAENLLAWPPGLYVDHRHNGIGRVLANSTESLRIQFPGRTLDLSIEIAQRSLLRLDPHDLRVRLVHDRDGLARQAADDPAGLVHAALVTLGGEGGLPDLKRALIPGAVGADAWADFWKAASKAMKGDARIDLSQTARKIYRVAAARGTGGGAGTSAAREADARATTTGGSTVGGGAASGSAGAGAPAALPEFSVKTPLAKRAEALERFLDEDAARAADVAAASGPALMRLLAKEPATSDGRLAGALLLLRVGLIDDAAARDVCAAYFAAADEFPPSVAKGPQARCLALATGMENPVPVYLAMLASRTKAHRDEAFDLLAAHLGEEFLATVLRLLRKSPERAAALLHIASREEIIGSWPAWDALLALLRIVQTPPRPAQQKQALEVLTESEALHRGLREFEPDPQTGETVRLELHAWKTSERLLVPILDALTAIGRGALAEETRASRRGGRREDAEGAAAAPRPALDDFSGRVLMTTASYERLREEVRRIGTELKTSIPKAIETARAHGDLSENAEYEAAKDKQRRFAARLVELEEKWNRAKIIDAGVVKTGIVGPGVEVAIEDVASGDREAYWILGEGDDHHGENVISYLAPLGKALAGKRVGDEAAIARAGGERRFRIVSLETRLPEA